MQYAYVVQEHHDCKKNATSLECVLQKTFNSPIIIWFHFSLHKASLREQLLTLSLRLCPSHLTENVCRLKPQARIVHFLHLLPRQPA